MLCVVIKGPDFFSICRQLNAVPKEADLVELRLDCFENLEMGSLHHLRSLFSIPMIFTLRPQSQGGFFQSTEEERLQKLYRLLKLNPEYLDLESHVTPDFSKKIASEYPHTKLIISYHNFEKTPANLLEIYQEMKRHPADHYKIACRSHSTVDSLRLLDFGRRSGKDLNVMSMRDGKEPTRVLGPIYRQPITYACLDDNASAPGQLTARSLLETYHFKKLGPQTKVYGLIGDLVEKSISQYTHNFFFRSLGIDAVYVKFQVKPAELSAFIPLAKTLGFSGLSVTMPLKEAIVPFIENKSAEVKHIKAANTLRFKGNIIYGFNTDGFGALNAIESRKPVLNRKLALLGTGGASKAIAYEASRRGADICMVSRSKQKTGPLCAYKVEEYGDLQANQNAYDILINCTPHSMPITADTLHSNALVMDINTMPKETELLQNAKKKGAGVVYGYEMFVEQALGQFRIWFDSK